MNARPLENAAEALQKAHELAEAVQAQVEALDQKLAGKGANGLMTALCVLVQQLLEEVADASEDASTALREAEQGNAGIGASRSTR